jgi:hypothetical protein
MVEDAHTDQKAKRDSDVTPEELEVVFSKDPVSDRNFKSSHDSIHNSYGAGQEGLRIQTSGEGCNIFTKDLEGILSAGSIPTGNIGHCFRSELCSEDTLR